MFQMVVLLLVALPGMDVIVSLAIKVTMYCE
jgi:hypothetical protein